MAKDVTGISGELFLAHDPPCISIYMPTNRSFPDNVQDSVRFSNLVGIVEKEGFEAHGKRAVSELIDRLRLLQDDNFFWKHSLDGVAVFISPDYFRTIRLQQPVRPEVYVSDVFFVKPLIGIFQTADRFQLLSLTRQMVRLYEGNRYRLDEIELDPEVPKTMTDALGVEITPPHMTISSFGGQAHGSVMRHGHSSRKDEEELDDERFFRAIDRPLAEHHSNPSGLPLILAALPQHQSLFRSVSHNPHLVAKGIDRDPQFLDTDELRDMAWKVLEPQWLEKIGRLSSRFEEALSKSLGSGNPFEITEAALAGKVSVLLLDQERIYPGGIDAVTGDILFSKATPGGEHDVFEDLAITVLGKGGEVLVLPSEQVPSASGVAAIFRHR